MKRIEVLTADQIARMTEFRDKWLKIGLSTEPADRQKAELAIVQMYAAAKLPPPKIVWCGSPLSQGLTRAIILDKKHMDSVWASVGDSVWASVRDSVWDSVRASVWDSVRDSVGDSVGDSVRDSVRDSVGDSVWASVGDSVGDSVWDSVRDSVGDSVGASGYGQHDAGWLSFYDYFRSVTGLEKETEALLGHMQQAQSAGWYLPHAKICWVSERHHILVRDDRGRLHCPTGPAVMYPDGWAIYAWHGVRLPASVIENRETLTTKQIIDEQNVEVRRCMMEIYGQGRFAQDAGATVIDICAEHGAELLSLPLPPDDPEGVMKAVRLTCPTTGHLYFERVPPGVTGCLEALAWRGSIQPAQYKPVWQS